MSLAADPCSETRGHGVLFSLWSLTLPGSMRASATGLLFAFLAAAGCAAPAPPADLTTPEATIRTFHAAFARDDRPAEYACLSERVKERFGNLLGYSLGADVLRSEHPLLVRLASFADLEGRLSTEILADGLTALAHIDAGGGAIEVRLVYEPRYVLVTAAGETIEGYARRLAAGYAPGRARIDLLDPRLQAGAGAAARAELHPRWAIDDLPGLDSAVERARRERGSPGGPKP